MEISLPAGRSKTLEEQRQVEIHSCLHLDNGRQSRANGGSLRPDQPPSQRPLDFDRLSLEPDAFSKREYTPKEAAMASSDVKMSDVSSAYWEMGDKAGKPGRQRPQNTRVAPDINSQNLGH